MLGRVALGRTDVSEEPTDSTLIYSKDLYSLSFRNPWKYVPENTASQLKECLSSGPRNFGIGGGHYLRENTWNVSVHFRVLFQS
jgi:hypothetical protein